MNRDLKSYIAITLAVIFWSLAFIWFKIANEVYRPITIVFFRVTISSGILFLFLLVSGKLRWIPWSDLKWFVLMSFFEPFIYFLGESYGLTYVSSTVASVLIATIPIFAALGSWLIYRENLRFINYSGILLSFAGVVIFILTREGRLTFEVAGLILLMIAVFAAVGYTLVLKKVVENYSPAFIVMAQNLIGAIMFLPLFITLEVPRFPGVEPFTPAFNSILKLAIFTSGAAFILFSIVVKNIGVTRANAFANAIPVLTAFFAFFMLGDRITVQQLTGMIIVITGLFLSQYGLKSD